jgi:hypothetical protein
MQMSDRLSWVMPGVFVVWFVGAISGFALAGEDRPGAVTLRLFLAVVPVVVSCLALMLWASARALEWAPHLRGFSVAGQFLAVSALACALVLDAAAVLPPSRQWLLQAVAADMAASPGPRSRTPTPQPEKDVPPGKEQPLAPPVHLRGVVVLDASLSTGRNGALPVMQQALTGLGEGLGPQDRVVLVVASLSGGRHSGSPRVAAAVTGRSPKFTRAVSGVVARGQTGLHEALASLARPSAQRLAVSGQPVRIVVVTDGVGLNDERTGETPTDVGDWGGLRPTVVVVGPAKGTPEAKKRCGSVRRVVRGLAQAAAGCESNPLDPLIVRGRLLSLLSSGGSAAKAR